MKFSHLYWKIPPEERRLNFLVGVSTCDLSQLPQEFIQYDTRYSAGYYPLPKRGKYMVLTIFTEHFGCWTTVRRWTPRKHEYYQSIIGNLIPIDIDLVGGIGV